jgi:mannose-1-phosphate guanylyltransferase
MLHALILAGGAGTRYWPLSRRRRPKHLLSLDGGPTLLAQALARVDGLVRPEHTWVVTTEAQAEALAEALPPEIPRTNVIAEPALRDTAAALGLGATAIAARDAEAILVAMPADHVIRPASRFRDCVLAAATLVARRPGGTVATLGIPPARPAVSYGYIRAGRPIEPGGGHRTFEVESFREKPDRTTAESYLAMGGHYWNAGIFIWRAKDLLAALERRLPATAAALARVGEAFASADPAAVSACLAREYSPLKKISIDYAVLEAEPERVIVIEADFEWSDVGSLAAFPELFGADSGEVTVVNALHRGLDTRRTTVVGSGGGRLVATVGVEDIVIIETPDAVLVCRRDRVEDVKRLVERIERDGPESVL